MTESIVRFIEVYQAPDGFRWRAKGGNGEIVATGEAYTRHADAIDAAKNIFPGVDEIHHVSGETSDA